MGNVISCYNSTAGVSTPGGFKKIITMDANRITIIKEETILLDIQAPSTFTQKKAMTHYLTPFRADKNLGKAYNDAMRLIPAGDTAVLMDYDVLLLTPTTPLLIEGYAAAYPNAVLVCYTNRISVLSKQLFAGAINAEPDIRVHTHVAHMLEKQPMRTTLINRPISGFLMVVPRHVWERVPFPETGQCLGVDTAWSRSLHNAGVEIRLMETIYVWHTYRLMQGHGDKRHLK